MKRIRSSRQQPTASPCFPRGLELALWVAGLLLLGCGLNHFRTKNHTADAASATASPTSVSLTRQEQSKQKDSNSEGPRMETPQDSSLKAIIENIESEQDMDKREELIKSLVDSVAPANIQTTLIEFGEMEQQHSQHALVEEIRLLLIRRWAQFDAVTASAWVQQLPVGAMRLDALAGVAIEWANTNLSDAITWAQRTSDITERNLILSAVANEAVRIDPVVALRLATDLPQDTQRDELIRHAAMEWASTDGEQAVTWARQIGDAQLRDQVLASMAAAMSKDNPVSAATMAVKDISPGRAQDDAVIGIVERWAESQPEQVAAWVEAFPKNNLKSLAIQNLVAIWSLSNPQKAEQWHDQVLAGN